jgi:hypothetical protein
MFGQNLLFHLHPLALASFVGLVGGVTTWRSRTEVLLGRCSPITAKFPKKAYRRANSPNSIGKFQRPENLLRRFFPTSCSVADEVDSQVQPNAIKLTMKPPCTLKRQYSAANRDS